MDARPQPADPQRRSQLPARTRLEQDASAFAARLSKGPGPTT